MIREDRFVLSHNPYALDLSRLEVEQFPHTVKVTLPAVWYRRKAGITYACVGRLGDIRRERPVDISTFLGEFTDGRYGGECEGRWDGSRYWGAQEPKVMEGHLEILRPMLVAYPTVPEGYDGWWAFRAGR